MQRVATCHVCLILLLILGPLSAQEGELFEQAKTVKQNSLEEGAGTQKKIDQIDDERLQMLSDYRATLKQAEDLEKYNDHLRVLIASQEEEKKSLETQIDRITGLEREIVPLMSDMLDTLEEFIELDVPFLLDERRARVKKLHALLNDANITNSEKYRRILEAYQIENDYGRYIKAYEGTVNNGDDTQIVNYLKIGRIAFMYQTMDGKKTYIWNRYDNNWQPLADSYNSHIKTAINMAQEIVPYDLMFVPVVTSVTSM